MNFEMACVGLEEDDLGTIFRNLHRSAYRHFERMASDEGLQVAPGLDYNLHLKCPQIITWKKRSSNSGRKRIRKNRTVLHTLNEVAKRLSDIRTKVLNSKRKKVSKPEDKGPISISTECSEPVSKLDSFPASIEAESHSSLNLADGNEYLADTSRLQSAVWIFDQSRQQSRIELN